MKLKAIATSMLVLAVALVVLVVYVQFRPSEVDERNRDKAREITRDWNKAAPVPSAPVGTGTLASGEDVDGYGDGKPFAVLRVSKINLTTPIAQGVGSGALKKGVGHYKSSVGPGQTGNFATAGHVCCQGSGQPYKKIHKLAPGDTIVVETKDAIYTYTVVVMPDCESAGKPGPGGHLLVTPDHAEVIRPVPCKEQSVKPARKLMTLTTCYPDRSIVDLTNRPAPYRLIVWAELSSSKSK